MIKVIAIFVMAFCAPAVHAAKLFHSEAFGQDDAVLVVEASGQTLFDWQSDKALIPASLTKLATAHLAIEKWGLDHRFITEFYTQGDKLWIKGYGDPFLVSEELTLIADRLSDLGVNSPSAIYVDNSYFDVRAVPGRTKVADPYNAPLAAVSANFNTAMLTLTDGGVASAEPQTPLTPVAQSLSKLLSEKKVARVNLISADNAQRNFAQLMALKAGWQTSEIHINQLLPDDASEVYRHASSKTLAQVLQATLEFSNNFIANQVFLQLAGHKKSSSVSFADANRAALSALSQRFHWQDFTLEEGAGLSRNNRFSARQLDELLVQLKAQKTLLKSYSVKTAGAQVNAKTGTLSDVHSFAGYIALAGKEYRFVFNFNRQVGSGYRRQLLEKLVAYLAAR